MSTKYLDIVLTKEMERQPFSGEGYDAFRVTVSPDVYTGKTIEFQYSFEGTMWSADVGIAEPLPDGTTRFTYRVHRGIALDNSYCSLLRFVLLDPIKRGEEPAETCQCCGQEIVKEV